MRDCCEHFANRIDAGQSNDNRHATYFIRRHKKNVPRLTFLAKVWDKIVTTALAQASSSARAKLRGALPIQDRASFFYGREKSATAKSCRTLLDEMGHAFLEVFACKAFLHFCIGH